MPMGIRVFVGHLLQLLAPSYGACYRCEWPWKFTRSHTTHYLPYEGCFPLCQKCWEELETPERRLPFYEALVNRWAAETPLRLSELQEKWDLIQAAVMEGK